MHSLLAHSAPLGDVGGFRGAGDTEPSFLGFVSNVSVVVGRSDFFSLILLVGSLFLCSGQRYCCQNEKQGSRSLLQCDQPEGLQGDLLIVIIS